MLTIFFVICVTIYVSYTFKKYSDFWYNGIMVEQHENWAIKIFSDFCCNGCSCKGEKDHEPVQTTNP